LPVIDKSRNPRLQKPLRQPVQLPQPGRIQHRHSVHLPTITEHVRGIGADRARRAIRQVHHQQQHTVPTLKRLRPQQTPEQRMRLRDNPHLTRQHRTQLLQSVAFTPGTGKTHLSVGLARAAAHAGYRTYFTTAADLAARCHRAAIEGRWATTCGSLTDRLSW
jgi:Mrp family chromosome partitioning ATPase